MNTRGRVATALAVTGIGLTATGASASASVQLYAPGYGNDEVFVFDYGADGSLTPLSGSPFPTGSGGTIGFGISPDGKRAVAPHLVGSTVSGFSIDSSGALSSPTSAPATRTYTPVTSPDNVHVYIPSDGGPADGGVYAFTLGPGGELTQLGSGLFGDTDVYVVAITPDARFLYSLGVGGITRFRIEPDGSLTPLGTTAPGGTGATSISITPNGRFLYTVNNSSDDVTGFSIGADGALASTGSPTPVTGLQDALPEISPDGRFLYVPVSSTDTVVTLAIAGDGGLTQVGSPATAGTTDGVSAVTESPDGKFLIARDQGGPSEADLTRMSIGADGRPTLATGVIAVTGGEPVAAVFRPAQPPVARATATRATPGSPSVFDATGSSDPDGSVARFDWDFGDGTGAPNAGPSPQHAYASAGVYTATVTLTDDLGCSTSFVAQGQRVYCNGGPGARATVQVDTLPALSGLRVSNRKFAAASAKPKVKRGTAFLYTLTEAASVRFAIERKLPGRRVRGKCRRKTKRNRLKPRCTRFKKAGAFTTAATAGSNRTRFSGKLRGKRLKAGRYRATAIAMDGAGGTSTPKTVRFRVVRPRPPR